MLLLVVLSLLVLFTLIAVTFVLVAGAKLTATKNELRIEQFGDDPRELCDDVLARVIRDVGDRNDTVSVLHKHSLLRDLYGNDGARGRIESFAPATGSSGQFIDLRVIDSLADLSSMEDYYHTPTTNFLPVVSASQFQTPGFYNGCVLTMVSGELAGQSTRIVGWGYYDPANPATPPPSANHRYVARVLAFQGSGTLNANDRFIINGRPFNGTGFGFNPITPPGSGTLLTANVTLSLPGNPTAYQALLPNPVYHEPVDAQFYNDFGGIGGADEDYDVADPQNMALAYLPVQPPSVVPTGATTNTPPAIIPSFHRPELFSYYLKKLNNSTNADDWQDIDLSVLNRISLRPVGDGITGSPNPNFNGSNPDYNPIYGPFDVDNDGDGIRESIWIDVGFPIQTAADGRRYKPLAAMLILDMDGRLNVNAHGSTAHVDAHYLGPIGTGSPAAANILNDDCFWPKMLPKISLMSRGEGYGPAEISLYPLFQGLGVPYSITGPPLPGYTSLLTARYAEPNLNLTGNTYDTGMVLAGGSPLPPYPGITSFDDLVSGIRYNEFPSSNNPGMPSAFSSYHDLYGKGYQVFDVRGMPVRIYTGERTTTTNRLIDTTDDPYELNLSRRAVREASTQLDPADMSPATPAATLNPVDRAFSPGELERLLRLYDVDAGELPDRLRALLATGGGPAPRISRNMVTTDSFDIPAPAIMPTTDMRQVAASQGATEPLISQHITDLLKLRMMKARMWTFPTLTPVQEQTLRTEIAQLLPPELVAGLRMDINRPFGNGRDDTPAGTPGYEVVDEPGETETAFWLPGSTAPTQFAGVTPNLTNGMSVDGNLTVDGTDAALARQLYARHLYVLMMLLRDEATDI